MENKLHILQHLFNVLKSNNYEVLQYIPTRKSLFGIFKEIENLANLRNKEKHLMFYYSVNPGLYINYITKGNPVLKYLFKFCFLNQSSVITDLEKIFGAEWIKKALDNNVLYNKDGKYYLSYSVLPINEYLILRDAHSSYSFHELDEKSPQNRVYVGADSVKFVSYNQKYLKGNKFKSTLELGCGTGIQLICIEKLSEKLTGLDINPRAVEFTKISAMLNGLGHKFEVIHSDLFEKINAKYDLILANPWFIDIEKGGLEEIPDIIEKLDGFLEDNGVFAMYFGSYIKDGIDQAQTLVADFAIAKGYDAVFYQLGKTIEPGFLDRYKTLNISHINSYYVILTKNKGGNIKILKPKKSRQIRDEIYIPIQKLVQKFKRQKQSFQV